MNPIYDFHSHSHFSDGKLTPEELLDYACERNIDWLALTDHDCIDGVFEAARYVTDKQLSIRLIAGVEISAMTEYGEVHVVGLNLDINNSALKEGLITQQTKRWDRAEAICIGLEKAGVKGVFKLCQERVKQVITRSHIAQAIVETGHAKDLQQAFKKYIGKNARIKIPKDWMRVETAIELIQNAGGIAVLAHPTRYPLTNRKLSYLIKNFAESGGNAIELAYPSLAPDKMLWLKQQMELNQLVASSGSDFHYPDLRWTDLGRFPRLDSSIPHVAQQLN